MKAALLKVLKVAVPLAIGAWLVYYNYHQLSGDQRRQLFDAFRQADPIWLVVATFIGWSSHVSRGWRWHYLLDPLGQRTGFWSRYHAVMIGYFMNLFIQRAGEVSRAATIYRTDGVPFEKAFGTILAERAVDMVMMLAIAGLTLALQFERMDALTARVLAFREGQAKEESGPWFWVVVIAVVLAMIAAAYLLLTRPALRARLMDLVRGFGQGLKAVLTTRHKGLFLLHTLFIWACYFLMFWLGFFALPATADVPLAGVLAGFIAGAVGIILVQGGIGVYPVFVALIVSIYMAPTEGGGNMHPEALAMGWLLWVLQTAMIVVLGGLSLLLARRKVPAA